MTHYLIDLDNTLLHTYYFDNSGKISFHWTKNFEKDFNKSISILDDFFAGLFKPDINLNHYVTAFLKKHQINMEPESFLTYWLSRDNNQNQNLWSWICNQKQKGHHFSIASNQPEIRMSYLWQNRPEWHPVFDHVFTSDRLGVAKPDPAFFISAQKTLQTPFQEICLIDDNPDNCQTARQLNMKAILFQTIEDVK